MTLSQRAASWTAPEVKAARAVIEKAAKTRQRAHGGTAPGRKADTSRNRAGSDRHARETSHQVGRLARTSARLIEHAQLGWKKAPKRMRAIQTGQSDETVSRVANEIRRKAKADAAQRAIERGVADFKQLFTLKRYDVWNISQLDPGYGQKWPGNIPGSLVANVLYYFTARGALVVDPQEGGRGRPKEKLERTPALKLSAGRKADTSRNRALSVSQAGKTSHQVARLAGVSGRLIEQARFNRAEAAA